jgi:hypothetical protein
MKLTPVFLRTELETYTFSASYIFMVWYICIYQAILTTGVGKQKLLS